MSPSAATAAELNISGMRLAIVCGSLYTYTGNSAPPLATAARDDTSSIATVALDVCNGLQEGIAVKPKAGLARCAPEIARRHANIGRNNSQLN